MPLDTAEKQKLINSYQKHATDTGSVEVQVAMLSERISKLSGHLQKSNHDYSSRKGLLKMIGRRKRLLNYVREHSEKRYNDLVVKLGIRG
ncbi:30S ribosomal protein S15 [Prochlorococcus sp. MIT 1307]|uniref:30S ribosomal protein S15 n=1 Tax=Prochlorococcus sp. MIT 1307 TaxID=3096219 RepID=UPI002A760E22|nr:30S ribosomal protein S15 [Prochlorococcus sp. MIT 1307]